MNRTRAALLALAGLLLALLPSLGSPATAGPVDGGWSAVAVNPAVGGELGFDPGDTAAARMTYDVAHAGVGTTRTWELTTRATAASAGSPITVPWTWQGLHAWFKVSARMDLIVNGVVVQTLVNAGPASCCTSPSNGFLYGGVATFPSLSEGDVYGFRLSGSNSDRNDFLRGTLILSNKPYLEELGRLNDNRQWTGATELADDAPATGDRMLAEPGEARWFKIKVVPGQRLQVDLSGLPHDYDLALYGDIAAAFAQLTNDADLTKLVAGGSASSAGNGEEVPSFDNPDDDIDLTKVPSKDDPPDSVDFAPRVYAPRVYAPRVYAPRVYAPRVYAPNGYDPQVGGSQGFREAFAAAQDLTLLAVSTEGGTLAERVAARTGDSTGYFYVRVQAHDDATSDDLQPFTLERSFGRSACNEVSAYSTTPTLGATSATARSVILTDTDVLFPEPGQAGMTAYLGRLDALATATDGVVVDLAGSQRIDALREQLADHPDCTYAADLVAGAARDIVNSYRNDDLRYVVLAGGDDVVPFFRYPDRSGFGEEKQFELQDELLTSSPSTNALEDNQVLSQDAYGSATDLTLSGGSLAVPDLAVGRLVKTPQEIQATIDHFIERGGTLPTPQTSLVTGYDFLADAATAVGQEFRAALGSSAVGADELVTPADDPSATPWDRNQLFDALTTTHHDLVFLAGHFSANDTLAADFDTTVSTDELARGVLDPADPDAEPPVGAESPPPYFTDSLVISPGCHSGYGIDEDAAGPLTNSYDWTQYMAQQKAVLVAGTGYQYGDSDFLAYSERLYLDLARRLRSGTTTQDPAGTEPPPPVSVGEALVAAKRDYLAALGTLTGIDQKAVQQATLYGLPMTTIDVAGRDTTTAEDSQVDPEPVTGGGPGSVLGLQSASLDVATPLTRRHKPSGAAELGLPADLTWFEGTSGVQSQPGAPVVPQQIVDVSSDTLLRGVGFRTGTYHQESGLLPLTGAPAVEGTTPHTTFFSPAWFPQQLTKVNYFDALDTRGAAGRTSLVLSPAQWRSDVSADEYADPDGPAATNTARTFSELGLQLFYSGLSAGKAGGNQPALAAAPGISQVQAYGDGSRALVSVRAAGDPSAGVQQVWITWTAGPDGDGDGTWQSLDLVQDPVDSTLWTASLPLAAGAQGNVRFLVQAVNGVGAVSLDTADGNGYEIAAEPDTAGAHLDEPLVTTATATPRAPGRSATVLDSRGVGAADYDVRFQVVQDDTLRSSTVATSDADGHAALVLQPGTVLRPGPAQVSVILLRRGTTDSVLDTFVQEVTIEPDVLSVSSTWLTADPFRVYASTPVTATLTDARGQRVPGATIGFSTPVTGPTATFSGPFATGEDSHHAVAVTNADGLAQISTSRLTAAGLGGTFAVTASSATSADAISSRPLSVNFDMGPFISPVLNKGGTTSAKLNSTTPVKVAVLNANGRPIDDATGATMASRNQVVVSWRLKGSPATSPPIGTAYSTYVPEKDFFQADLKASAPKWAAGKTYTVTVTVNPWWNDLPPPFGLESKSFDISITK